MTASTVACCIIDGDPIPGKPFCYPNRKKENGKFGFDKKNFYSPNVALWWITHVEDNSPHLITYLQLYCKRDLGIEEDIIVSPGPGVLAKYNVDGLGLSVSEFRSHGNTRLFVERIDHLPIDRRVWIPQDQKDNVLPFYEVVRDQSALATQLLIDKVNKNEFIPKALQTEADILIAERKQLQATVTKSDISIEQVEDDEQEVQGEEPDAQDNEPDAEEEVQEEEEEDEGKTAEPEPPKGYFKSNANKRAHNDDEDCVQEPQRKRR